MILRGPEIRALPRDDLRQFGRLHRIHARAQRTLDHLVRMAGRYRRRDDIEVLLAKAATAERVARENLLRFEKRVKARGWAGA